MNSESKTELQRLLEKRFEDLATKYRDIRVKREQLEAEAKQLEGDMVVVKEALNVEARASGQVTKKTASNGNSLLGLKLGQAIRILREENPKISKIGVRNRLRDLGYDFKGKRPGSAVHMAWTQLERQKHKGGDT